MDGNLEAALSSRDSAMDLVAENSGNFMLLAAMALKTLSGEMTGEEIRNKISAINIVPHHHNAWGAFIAAGVRSKVLRHTGRYEHMSGPRSHARMTPVYAVNENMVIEMPSESAVKADLYAILNAVPDGYGALRLAIMEGRIDPVFPNATRVMRQGCLKAHLAEYMGCASWELPGAARLVLHKTGEVYVESAAEKAIAHVRYGDKPANCTTLKTLIGYMDEWLAARQQDDWMAVADDESHGTPTENLVELDDQEF